MKFIGICAFFATLFADRLKRQNEVKSLAPLRVDTPLAKAPPILMMH
jgi:hypothetical protein